MTILDELRAGKILLSDGALGTMLQVKGLQPGHCPELWNVDFPGKVQEIAVAYRDAGSQIITTNSFGANRVKLSQYGCADRLNEINKASVSLIREAVGNDVYIAGSIGPTGKMLLLGDITEEELYEVFREQAVALGSAGADAIIIETMSAQDEAALAVNAARENTSCTIIVTMTFSKDPKGEYYTMMGISPHEMVVSMKEAGAHIVGSNCGNGISEMIGITRAIRETDTHIPVMIQANAGAPQFNDGITTYLESPGLMASFIPGLIEAGANIIGGCCGTTPEHIRAIEKVIRK